MKKMITNLSKNLVKANLGFNLREDLNFTDDGNRFRGFDYKGLPITTLRADGTTYCSIRVDYLANEFTYKEWMNTEEYKLCDEFNGVDKIDLEKLINNCEKILAKVAELNKNCSEEELDILPVIDRLMVEEKIATAALEHAKTSVKWWELKSYYDFKRVREAFRALTNTLNSITAAIEIINEDRMSKTAQRWHLEHLRDFGYVKLEKKNY